MNKLVFLIICFNFTFTIIFSNEYLKKAQIAEERNDFENAVKYLNLYLQDSKFQDNDKVYLKIARLTQDTDEKIEHYINFLNKYSDSRFYLLAAFELANYYLLIGKYDDAIKTFDIVINKGIGTPYWQKSMLKKCHIYIYNKKDYVKSKIIVYELLQEISDYEDLGISYFYLGKIALDEKNIDDAIEYFLISAGSFSESSGASQSLLELIKIYKNKNDLEKSSHAYTILHEKFRKSYEYKEALKLRLKLNNFDEDSKIYFISFEDEEKNRAQVIEKIKNDISDSEFFKTNKSPLKGHYYIQIGYYSNKTNAFEMIDKLKVKDIDGLSIIDEKKDDKIYHRLVKGPYINRDDANKVLIFLKTKGIEAIIREFRNIYE